MKFLPKTSSFKFEYLLGGLIALSLLAHIPSRLWVGAFDRNAAPQFIFIVFTGMVSAIYLAAFKKLEIARSAALALLALLLCSVISLLLSDNFYASLIGDTGRFSGIASLWSLVMIALAASTFSPRQFLSSLLVIVGGITLVTVLGALQALGLVNLPTGGGVGSTLGNLDFLAALIGTTLLLVLVATQASRFSILLFTLYLAIAIYVLWEIDAKQGWVDLLIVIAALLGFKVIQIINLPSLSSRVLKSVATFFLLLWTEAIYIIPMSNIHLPWVTTDPNVSIRADFWFAAAQMFRHHFGFGVGPDNYGNHYEEFRSLNSVKNTELVLANDAHSSMMQTMATLGVFATLAFLVLALFVIYGLIDLHKKTGSNVYLLLLLSFFVFYTNSQISPIPTPVKAIFWLVAGFVIGYSRKVKEPSAEPGLMIPTRLPMIAMSSLLILALYSFIPGYVKVNSALAEEHQGKRGAYSIDAKLPCIVYTNAQLNLVARAGQDVKEAAEEILTNHPRCIDALGYLANEALNRRDYREAKPYVYQLLEVAPARQSVVRIAAIYAMGAGDEDLKNLLTSQGLKLGILTESQL